MKRCVGAEVVLRGNLSGYSLEVHGSVAVAGAGGKELKYRVGETAGLEWV